MVCSMWVSAHVVLEAACDDPWTTHLRQAAAYMGMQCHVVSRKQEHLQHITEPQCVYWQQVQYMRPSVCLQKSDSASAVRTAHVMQGGWHMYVCSFHRCL